MTAEDALKELRLLSVRAAAAVVSGRSGVDDAAAWFMTGAAPVLEEAAQQTIHEPEGNK